ncbi:MAG: RNA-binding transcriptional accessory protein, partial [Firmicutes bacterium]|nr:RNA-binding transcriptional accessory protein [Bacillota bacterium]
HGSMDDTTLRDLTDRMNYLKNLEARKEEIRRSIEGQEKMTPELSEALENAATLTEAEDLYRPYKQKKRTRASMAKEKGLEPLAALIWTQSKNLPPLEKLAENYIDKEKGVADGEEALAGASDIIAEFISDSAEIRSDLRKKLDNASRISSKAAGEEDSVYRLYYEFDQPLKKLQDHQVLALNRGEKEGFLKVSLDFDDETALQTIARDTIRGKSEAGEFIRTAAEDSWGRLLSPSLKNEFRSVLTEKACEGAIRNFALNLKPLLMQPPVKGAVTMGLDPGYRNGCKVAVIDPTGKVLDTCVVYPTFNERKKQEAIEILGRMVKKHKVRHLAIGNGTASRETEQMAIEMIRKLGGGVSYMIVNEAGASVYSASKLAAKEFPEFDVNLRSAVSIARRLQDPLAELVKIDPKAIGVGQYQHDMPQKRLDESLSGVVEDCVNAVGVDLNTASAPLLQRVSGLSSAVAENIVKYREENGPFRERKQLLKVPKLGPKAFEQSAGFLRIPGGASVLDNTGVHPESYPAAQMILQQCGYTLEDVQARRIGDLPKQIKAIGEKKLAETCGIGVPTLRDIMKELIKPGRDPRDELPPPILRTDVLEISDLKPGMKLKGTVRNVIDFGAFVDIGVHQDGLVHISQIADRYIKHPSEVLTVGQVVDVTVLEVDEKKKRISLSMRSV